MFSILVTFLIVNASIVALSIPLIRGSIAPNRYYGFRTRRTLSDKRVWYPANSMSGRWLALAGTISIISALVLYPTSADKDQFVTRVVLVMSCAMGLALIQSFRYLRRLR